MPRTTRTAAFIASGVVLASAVIMAVVSSAQATALPAAAPTLTAATPAPYADLRCGAPSTNSFGFTPHLTLVTQFTTIQRTTAYRNCSASAFPNIRSGYEHKTNNIYDDCVIMLQAGGNAQYNITWNTSQTSTLAVQRSASLSGNTLTVTFTGTVTAGLFTGRNVRQVFTADATELIQCLNGTGQVPFLISDVSLIIYP